MTTERLPVASGQWVCDPNAIVCAFCDSLLAYYASGFRSNRRDMSGHDWIMCKNCDPATYFLAVASPLPYPMVTCYPISRESYVRWDTAAGRSPPTPELLYYLRDPLGRSWNPYWQPASNRRTR